MDGFALEKHPFCGRPRSFFRVTNLEKRSFRTIEGKAFSAACSCGSIWITYVPCKIKISLPWRHPITDRPVLTVFVLFISLRPGTNQVKAINCENLRHHHPSDRLRPIRSVCCDDERRDTLHPFQGACGGRFARDPAGAISQAARMMLETYRFFPPGTIHVEWWILGSEAIEE